MNDDSIIGAGSMKLSAQLVEAIVQHFAKADILIYPYDKLDDEDRAQYRVSEGQILVCAFDRYVQVFDSTEVFVHQLLTEPYVKIGRIVIGRVH